MALLDLWLWEFLGDVDIGNVYPCTTLIVRRYYNQCIRRALTVYGRYVDGLWFDVIEELVIL